MSSSLKSKNENSKLENESYDLKESVSSDIDLFDFDELNKLNKNSKFCNNFSSSNILSSRHHLFTSNQKSLIHSYIYTNTGTILNKFIMSFEEQLHKAIIKGNYELCNEIVKKKCNLDKHYDFKLPLCLACEYNQYEIAELLIKNGAEINQFDHYDQPSLIYACDTADFGLIQLLVKYGADINFCESKGAYPLHVAINRKNNEICDYLIEQGADIGALDK